MSTPKARRPDLRVVRPDGSTLAGFVVEQGRIALFKGDELHVVIDADDLEFWGTVKGSSLTRARLALEAGTHEPRID